jgi:tRNA threonylcarbamoyladenosine biosynthesis protein TsaB
MKILALDTATEACSAALSVNGEIMSTYRLAPREHNRLILSMIEELMGKAQLSYGALDAIAFGCGPGSFTGVRIATGVAQGLALGAELPLIPISTLAALAENALRTSPRDVVHTAIDARMGEVYWATYLRDDAQGVRLLNPEQVIAPDMIPSWEGRPSIATGSGWETYRDILSARIGQGDIDILSDQFPRAEAIARLATPAFHQGKTCAPDEAEPVYLRNDVAKKPEKRA